MGGSGNSRQFRNDPVREYLTSVRIVDIHCVVVVSRHGADDSRKNSHRVSVVTESVEETQHALVQHCVCANRRIECFQFIRCRQLSVQKEIRNFNKVRMLGELFYRVTPVHENAFLAVDECDVTVTATSRYKPGIVGEDTLFSEKAANFDDVRSGGPLANREFHRLSVWTG